MTTRKLKSRESEEQARRMESISQELAEHRTFFTALGDESRQAIVMALLNNYGGLKVGEIAEIVGLSRPAVSHHLKTLKEAGIVDMYERGTMNFYHMRQGTERWEGLLHLCRSILYAAQFAEGRSQASVDADRRDS